MTLPCRVSLARSGLRGIGCLAASAALIGCGSVLQGTPSPPPGSGGPGAAPYEHATGPEDVLVSVDQAGWYGPLEYELRNTASFLLLGDGTAIVPGAQIEIYPAPAIHSLQSAQLTEQQIQELFAMAEDAGLLGAEIDFGEPGITDQATTYVDITVDGRTVSQAAYALDYTDDNSPNMPEASRAARAALRDFIAAAYAMVGADTEVFQPEALLAHRLRVSDEIPRDPEFAQEPEIWPIATAPPPLAPGQASSCVEILGREATVLHSALVEANELTTWLIGAESATRMAFRPLLPGDSGCQE